MTHSIPDHVVKHLKKEVFALNKLPTEDWNLFLDNIHYREVEKGTELLKEGEVCKSVYLLVKGSIRMYSIEDGKEVNVDLVLENQLASDFKSFHEEKPSAFFMVAMEDCQLIQIIKKEYFPLLETTESLVCINWKVYQALLIKEEEHANMFKLFNPEERYQYILENRPELIQRIPVSQLASYLGMSRETLSRIRQRIS